MTLQSDLVLRQGYIDGAWVDADSGATFAVTNPASGEVVAEVPRMGAQETRRAIEAAQRALPGWRGMLAKERAAIMLRWHQLLLKHRNDPLRRRCAAPTAIGLLGCLVACLRKATMASKLDRCWSRLSTAGPIGQ